MKNVSIAFYRNFSLLMVALFVLGCGGGSGGKTEIVEERAPTYINLSPTSTQVLTTNHPTFKFERNINNTSSAILCSASTADLHDVKLKVIQIDNQTSNATVALEQILQVPNECRFEIEFPALTLEENQAYAWRVSDPDITEDASTVWNSFIYSIQSMGLEDSNPHECENNMVQDWTFVEEKTPWKTAPVPQFSANLPATVLANGDEDSGAGQLQTPYEIVFQNIAFPVEQGKYYQLKFSLKHQGKSDFQIKALAFNGMLDSLQPDSNTSIIGFTGTMTDQNAWVKVTLPAWRANGNFDNLALALVNDENQTVSALIDRVCLVEVNASGCGATLDNPGELPDGFDLNNSDPIVTNLEYLAGTVSDLYPDYNTSTANWFEDVNDSALECSSIGGELTEEEEQEIDMELLDPEMDAALQELNSSTTTMLNNINHDDSNESNITLLSLEPIQNTLNPDKCTDRIIDPTKPFGGRDIVYIHGLQLPALVGNVEYPPTFQEKWPVDKHEFYVSGDILKRAKSYWSTHIERELGAVYDDTITHDYISVPSNSFLIVSWSANQRTRYAVHAVLTQIRDAMAGTNPNVYQSKSAKEKGQCFGDNGIVVITHSTGGLIASAMFGIAENSHDPSAVISTHGPDINIHDTFGDVRFITEKINAQIGINAAYGGSPFAEAALKRLTGLALNPLTGIIAGAFLQQADISSWGSQMVPVLNTSSLVDLVPTVATSRWRPWMASSIPTLTMSGTSLGKSVGNPNKGKGIITGFDDLVLSPSSQSNSYIRRPVFEVKNSRKLKDKGVGEKRAKELIKDGKKASGSGYRNYYNTPYIAPTGMLQANSVKSVTSPTNWHVPNHHIVLQTTGNHFDNVNHVGKNGNNYAYTKHNDVQYSFPFTLNDLTITRDDERNYEETGVVFNGALYSTGLLSNDFASLNQEWIRKVSWGYNWFKVTWIKKPIKVFNTIIGYVKVPKFSSYYKEKIKWQRKYHLLKDYENKIGADYMYDYILKP